MENLPQTLPACLEQFATDHPNRVALRQKELGLWKEISWSTYAAAVRATARVLSEWGVGAGDHVAILADNRPEWLYVDLAAQSLGASSVGIYQTNPPDDVEYVLNHSGAKLIFCEDQEQVDKCMLIGDKIPHIERIVMFDPRGTRHYEDARLSKWVDALALGEKLMANEAQWYDVRVKQMDPKAPAMVIYTSGTTGQPKGAMISNYNVLALAREASKMLGADHRDFLLSYLPLCHVAEKIFSLFLPLTTGAVVHFGESIETVQQDLAEVSPTIFLGVPRIWEKMHAQVTLKMQDASWLKRALYHFFVPRGEAIAKRKREGQAALLDRFVAKIGDLLVFRPLQERLGLRRCRIPVSGAAPISPELLHWFHGIGVAVGEGYGQTESTGVSFVSQPDAIRIGTVGQLIPGMESKIAEDGEILLKGAAVFCGYLHNEESTRQTIDDDGWLHTGDIGEVDSDGYLSITGRKKEIIITAGGKNLSPEKIENSMKNSAYIKEAVAIGDARKFISALVLVDYHAVSDWASRRDIAHTSLIDLVGHDEVQDLVRAEIEKGNQNLARVEQVRSFRLFDKELHQDDGELTATQKVRRSAITEKYAQLIDSMYTRTP
ncbi:MAG: AMP-binding protein [Deltaproteobacteria bacterium]|nr:AMP-binding protein [Deltaproteobacteria bacterium]MBT6435643.1 AMP-binding protein [Deltaproteobacteria bacterium]